jgi:hypothetical protein
LNINHVLKATRCVIIKSKFRIPLIVFLSVSRHIQCMGLEPHPGHNSRLRGHAPWL